MFVGPVYLLHNIVEYVEALYKFFRDRKPSAVIASPNPHKLIPSHIRRGLLRVYIAVCVPWIVFFGFRFIDALDHPYQHRSFEAFWSLLIVPVGGPISLLLILWVLAGFRKSEQTASERRSEQTASEVKTGAKNDARPSQLPPKGSSTDAPKAKSPPDYTEAGKVLGRVFFEPDNWHEMRNISERDKLTANELALARVAIVKDAIKRLLPHNKAIKMSAGVDQYVAKTFAKQAQATTATIGILLYEQNASNLAELATILVRRSLSSDVSAAEIAPLLGGAVKEAEGLMRVSSSLDKLNDLKPR
jgi:hypothetical protein